MLRKFHWLILAISSFCPGGRSTDYPAAWCLHRWAMMKRFEVRYFPDAPFLSTETTWLIWIGVMICHDDWLVGPSWFIIIHPIWMRLKQLTSHQKVEILERNRQSWEVKRRKGAKPPLLIRRDTTTMTWAFIRVLNHGFTLGAIFPIIWKASVVWQVQWSNWSHPVISKSGKLPWQTCAYPIIFTFSEDRLRTSALKSESIKILQHVDQALFLLYNFVPWAEDSAEHSKPFWTLKVWPVGGELGATFRPRCWSQMVRSIQAETMRLSGLRGSIFKYFHLTFEHR